MKRETMDETEELEENELNNLFYCTSKCRVDVHMKI